ncbi:MAG: sulfonate ABC transporter permease [Rhodospirillaceae bacterium]|nr:sulfonate ABC transporter permease [Rhodospirillaceae bacterium]|tara:strand:+ start:330234 stop:331100 length:867 start_codon:yes stop_codon:yes gene_type:complete
MSETDQEQNSTDDQAAVEAVDPSSPSPMYQSFLRRVRSRRKLILLTQFILVGLFFALWEIAPRYHWVNPVLTSYPSAIWATFLELLADTDNNIMTHTWVTVQETIVGFTLSMILGVGTAILLWWWDFLYRVVDPFMVVANALPKIALVPIFYIWLGDVASIYAMAVAIAVFITILMVYSGFRETDPNKVKLVRTLGANKHQILRKVVLPSNVPVMVAALKINVGLALVGVIVGEFQAAKAGLGHLIIYGSQVFQMTLVMTSISMLAIISTIMYLAIMYLENTVMRHHS